MKLINRICQILAIVSGVAAVALFFLGDFATIVSNKFGVTLSGAQLAFGGSEKVADATITMAQSAHIWFCIIVTILGALFSILTFKFKAMRYAAPVATLITAVYMLVIALSNPFNFVDYRTQPVGQLGTVLSIKYSAVVFGITALLFAATILGIAHLLVSDKIAVAGTKKLTIPRRIIAFFRDYKSETKKIAWPNFKFVVKNTFIVLVICAIIGAFIWVLDWGLANVLKLLLGA